MVREQEGRAELVYSEGHQKLIKSLASGGNPGRTPMADVPDDGNPILAVASITLSKQPQVSGVQLPVSQIAIGSTLRCPADSLREDDSRRAV